MQALVVTFVMILGTGLLSAVIHYPTPKIHYPTPIINYPTPKIHNPTPTLQQALIVTCVVIFGTGLLYFPERLDHSPTM